MTKKKRIVIAISQEYIEKLDKLKIIYKTKQYSKVIKILLDTLTIKNNE